jgi:pimeloyl-ACP methyl ester carboxylesterase
MEPGLLAYKNSIISYHRFGSGPRPALCFHGYGEDASSYDFLAKYAGDQFSFYSIGLPFHGQTEWNEGLTFTTEDLVQIINKIPELHTLPPVASPIKLSILGFSLGGRIALSLCEAIPERVERIVLLAPDGLKTNFWYWLATQTWAGNKFFSFTMKHPGWFFGFLKVLNKLKLVNASIFKFVNYYIGDKEVRRLLYARWTTLRKLKPHLKKIRLEVTKNKIAVRLIYGLHDRIILSSVGERFRKRIKEQCSISVIHSGHQVLHEKHIAEILPALLH